MTGWTLVTFYTEKTPYEQEVQKLAASARGQDIPLAAYPVPARGSWRANLNAKSETILAAMNGHPGSDIVFVDADAVIRHRPVIFDYLSTAREWDIAAHFLKHSRPDWEELLSGTLWIANTPKGQALVKAWDAYAKRHPELRHQKCLQAVLLADQEARIYRLPASYTRIFDHPGMRAVTPVIEHFQASRRFRNRVGSIRLQPGGPFGLERGKP